MRSAPSSWVSLSTSPAPCCSSQLSLAVSVSVACSSPLRRATSDVAVRSCSLSPPASSSRAASFLPSDSKLSTNVCVTLARAADSAAGLGICVSASLESGVCAMLFAAVAMYSSWSSASCSSDSCSVPIFAISSTISARRHASNSVASCTSQYSRISICFVMKSTLPWAKRARQSSEYSNACMPSAGGMGAVGNPPPHPAEHASAWWLFAVATNCSANVASAAGLPNASSMPDWLPDNASCTPGCCV
mmetsp:Transcript_2573/g.6211  ORF Transcript_2573/g.6211 Transcript_2573/m.6211 type:complete len:247 (-) Transcript_2573:63-803(-)